LCARCAGVLHDLVAGKPAPYKSFPPTPESTPYRVFPNQMVAFCDGGHTWPVEMVWGAVPGADRDVRMRFPERWFPPQCPVCDGQARGFQRLPESA
jgi:hypothetical protein